jgi:hypothetical protein
VQGSASAGLCVGLCAQGGREWCVRRVGASRVSGPPLRDAGCTCELYPPLLYARTAPGAPGGIGEDTVGLQIP